jgi:hypothetical protein
LSGIAICIVTAAPEDGFLILLHNRKPWSQPDNGIT